MPWITTLFLSKRRDFFLTTLLVGLTALSTAGCVSSAPPEPPSYSTPPIPDTEADQPPALIGGPAAYYTELRYPQSARAEGAEGRIILAFVVDERGAVQEARVDKGAHPALDREALRVLRLMQYRPGVKDGQPVPVRMYKAVAFVLR
jgi:TonB family protein